jgi:hypothetical protein
VNVKRAAQCQDAIVVGASVPIVPDFIGPLAPGTATQSEARRTPRVEIAAELGIEIEIGTDSAADPDPDSDAIVSRILAPRFWAETPGDAHASR